PGAPGFQSFLTVDGGAATAPFSLPFAGYANASDLFPLPSGGLRGIVAGTDAGVVITYLGGPSLSDAGVFHLSTQQHAVRGIALREAGGNQYGAGFGFAVVQGVGLANVWS